MLKRSNGSPIRVIMLGLRGFPNVQGGVETHAEHLCPRLAQLGCDVEVIVRTPYMRIYKDNNWQGVRFRRIWAPKSKGLEAIVHTFLGVLYAAWRRPDILHIQAIGPALLTPLARLLGLRVVVTHHGPDYDRQKWDRAAKTMLRLGERWGARYANAVIAISDTIGKLLVEKFGIEPARIPNGVVLPELPRSTKALEPFGLAAGKYVLLVSRLVPEKRHLDLIDAFARADIPGWKLALVGSSDHPDEYTRSVHARVQVTPGVAMTGFQTGAVLRELYAHAGVFVLPSSHEGLPIALLEALGYGLRVVASDIPANREIGLASEYYFRLGDVEELAAKLKSQVGMAAGPEEKDHTRQWVAARYDWGSIAEQTAMVYRRVLGS